MKKNITLKPKDSFILFRRKNDEVMNSVANKISINEVFGALEILLCQLFGAKKGDDTEWKKETEGLISMYLDALIESKKLPENVVRFPTMYADKIEEEKDD